MEAYSKEFRRDVLAACDFGEGTRLIALRFKVSESWVRRIKQERREQGKLALGRDPQPSLSRAASNCVRSADRRSAVAGGTELRWVAGEGYSWAAAGSAASSAFHALGRNCSRSAAGVWPLFASTLVR